MAANEASAAGSVRTVVVGQVSYSVTYPKKGYAPDLASLGPDPKDVHAYSSQHAGLIDKSLAGPTCTASEWCVKSGYRFQVKTLCKQAVCKDYVVVATPVSTETGARTFCATSDGIIHVKTGEPLNAVPSVGECRTRPILQ
jgi:hypothetical protein